MTLKEKLRTLLGGLPKKIKIGKRYVGEGEPVLVIAEVGINHNGDVELAKKLIHEYTELIKGISAYMKFLRSKRNEN